MTRGKTRKRTAGYITVCAASMVMFASSAMALVGTIEIYTYDSQHHAIYMPDDSVVQNHVFDANSNLIGTINTQNQIIGLDGQTVIGYIVQE